MLVNNPWPHLITYDLADPKMILNNGASYMRVISPQFDYWFCQFSDSNSFRVYPIEQLMEPDHLKRVMNKEIFLVLENCNECFNESADGIYKNLVIDSGIPESQIILVSGGVDVADRVRLLADHLKKDTIKFEWFSSQELSVRDQCRVIKNQIYDKTLAKKLYPKKYLNLNRRWRSHRPAVLALLHERKLLDQGFNSFGVNDGMSEWDKMWWLSLINQYQNCPEVYERLVRGSDVKDLLPLYLDTEDLVTNRAFLEESIYPYYLDSYFSIINETSFSSTTGSDGRFLTEKTFKAISLGHPFLLVAPPRSLNLLKSLGYRTFSGIIDESYDYEKDDGTRLLMIIKEVERLCNLSEAELDQFLTEARKICTFNYNHLMNKKTFVRRIL
jgi:hypothetical protein